jgi:lysozyme family protein
VASFDQAVTITLEHEGGYYQNPKSGEVVNMGITQAFLLAHHLPASVDDVKKLTRVGAINLYRLYFWAPMRLTEIKDQTLAAKVFDLGVNQGPETSSALLQGAINDEWGRECLTVDGRIGDLTIGCANTGDAVKILGALRQRAADHYQKLAEEDPEKYAGDLKGWLIRLAS